MSMHVLPAIRILDHLRQVDWGNRAATPKYAVLCEALAEAIAAERCEPGTKLPAEGELTSSTPFSLGTVQRALRALVEDGVVERRQGHGSFVAARRGPVMDDPLQCRFVADDGVSFLPVYPRVLERVRIAERGPWSALLGQRRDNVLRIDRIIGIADQFTIYARFHVRADRFPALEEMPASALDGTNFTRLLVGPANLRRVEFDQTVTVQTFSDWMCRAIDVPPQTAGIVLRVIARLAGKPLYFQELYVPPTRWPLKVG